MRSGLTKSLCGTVGGQATRVQTFRTTNVPTQSYVLELDWPGVCTPMTWPISGKVYTSPLCQALIVPFLGILRDVFVDTVSQAQRP